MGKVKAIIFDVYQTLLDNDTDEEREDTYLFLSRWLSFHGVTIRPADLRGLYLELCREEISRSTEPYPDIDIGKVFSRILADHAGQGPPPAALVSEFALLFRISTTNHLAPFPGVIPMLESLKGKARIGIASNAQRLFTIPELATFGMADLFEGIVFSSDIGVCKPHRKIFTTALEAISAEPERTLFVGDNLVADVYGSQSAGMKAVWIDHGRGDDLTLITPDFTVKDHSSLTELLLSTLE